MINRISLIVLVCYWFSSCSIFAKNSVPIKIVKEPATYGNLFVQSQAGSASGTLQIKNPPSKFSGPSHLQYLSHACFTLIDNKYRYLLCPFNNLTQHELAYRWNAYQGVLGVWQQWEIVNNTFKSMKYTEGDSCGNSNREVQVFFQCGPSNQLKNVSEPNRCQYEGVFESPDVCSEDSMLVYPSLQTEMQQKWDELELQLNSGEITQQGYNQLLEEIFIENGLRQKSNTSGSEDDRGSEKPPSQDAVSVDAATTTVASTGYFARLDHCNEAFDDLKKQLKSTSDQLEALRVSTNETSSKKEDV